MKQQLNLLALFFALLAPNPGQAQQQYPAVPLVGTNPYFSVWSFRDNLTGDWSRHWTGAIQAMCGMIRIDGKTYRFMGPQPASVPAMRQTSLNLGPLITHYEFEDAGIRLSLSFTTALLPNDLVRYSRSVTYLTWLAASTDGKAHVVSIYLDVTGEWAVDRPNQQVVWQNTSPIGTGLRLLRIGHEDQRPLRRAGDDLRIDWGWMYVAAKDRKETRGVIAGDRAARNLFAESGRVPDSDDRRMPRAASDDWPVLASQINLGKVLEPTKTHLILAYDDFKSIELLGKQLSPFWRTTEVNVVQMLEAAELDHDTTIRKCVAFDHKLYADLKRLSPSMAPVGTAAFRQCAMAYGLANERGNPLLFPKENFSNGCISTVDVIYPAAPFFLVFSPELLRAQLKPVLDYAASPRWKFPFAPHDLGTYPKANGQVYGGGERTEEDQMPVEETGNMLIMLAALAKREGTADFAKPYWPMLEKWAAYLKSKGMDPENQLCTDDFAGHLAHNANLSIKAILAIACYGELCRMTGRRSEADSTRSEARKMALQWMKLADDGDHYRLAFDKPGTWSQKYNLVWDRILDLNIFPPSVARKEVAFYLKHINKYGLPLDSRKDYTKADWLVWTATLTETPAQFEQMVAPLARFLRESPSRVPFTDWYDTKTGKQVGFQARSVIGGVFIPMLTDKKLWRKRAIEGHNDESLRIGDRARSARFPNRSVRGLRHTKRASGIRPGRSSIYV